MKILNQKGQFLVEGILLMIVSLAVFIAGMNTLNSNHALSNMFAGPWDTIAGMIESGVWAPSAQAAKSHPNQMNRSLSLDPSKL